MKTRLLLSLTILFTCTINSIAQNALNFDGVDDFVQTSFSGVLGSTDRTFEAWVKVSSTAPSANLTILDYGLNAVGSRNTFLIDANRTLRFISGGTNANLPASSSTITANQWVHVAFVLDNGTGFSYINGVQVATGSLSSVNTPSGNANLTIGERVSGGSIPFAGSIDEVRIWNVARSPAEIMSNMNQELCSFPPSLVAYYQFNQGVAGGINTGLTNVIGEIGDTAIANNFSMTGPTSNWDSGAVITSITPLNLGVSLNTQNQTLTSNDTTAGTTYQWYDCISGSILVGDTTSTYSSRSGGTFAVIVSNGNCVDTSACFLLTSGSGNPPGEALDFDGVNDVVQTSFPGVLGSTNRTFEAWINVSSTAPSANLTILDYGLNAVGSRNTFLVNANRNLIFISGGTNANLPGSSILVQPNRWTHVAFVLDNGTGYLYIDGVQVSTGSLSSVNTPSGNANLTIGQRVSGGSIPFAGSIDEVRIWNIARTTAEIRANMNAEFCAGAPGLVAYFPIENGIAGGNNTSITTLTNTIGSGNGVLNNFALTGSSSNFIAPGASLLPTTINTTVSQSGLTIIANDTTVDRYQWIDCGNNTILAGDTNRTFVAPASGNYAVILTKNGCRDTSTCATLIGLSLDQTSLTPTISIQPNPSNGTLQIKTTKTFHHLSSLRIYNTKGNLVFEETLNNSSQKIDLNHLPNGIYFVNYQNSIQKLILFK